MYDVEAPSKKTVPLVSVDQRLKVGHKVRSPLDLIKYGPIRVLGQKSPGIVYGVLANIRRFQIGVRLLIKNLVTKGCLTALPGASDGNHRILVCRIEDSLLNSALNIGHAESIAEKKV